MMKREDFGLGKYLYSEWLILVIDYYRALRICEVIYEIAIPFVVGMLCSACYWRVGKEYVAVKALSNILLTAISILIGFTAMLVTLILTSDNENVKLLKTEKMRKKLHGQTINLYQGLHIQFSHILVSEIVLLILILFYLFCVGLGISAPIAVVFLALEIYLILNILLSILRGITSLYFAFYRSK